ncbi:transmembrane protein 154 isoform X2 [Cololabis saira]|nr:transmembrane protein 154 isoform X2 [Cololabis saira]
MRGPRVKTPVLLLLLLTSLTRTAFCQEYADIEPTSEPEAPSETEIQDTIPTSDPSIPENVPSETVPVDGSGHGSGDSPTSTLEYEGSGEEQTEEEGLSLVTLLIPVVLAVVVIAMIVCGILISRSCNKKLKSPEQSKEDKEDPYLDGSSTEKVPMPMFEEDVPSVLELEMEELDQWMKKDC